MGSDWLGSEEPYKFGGAAEPDPEPLADVWPSPEPEPLPEAPLEPEPLPLPEPLSDMLLEPEPLPEFVLLTEANSEPLPDSERPPPPEPELLFTPEPLAELLPDPDPPLPPEPESPPVRAVSAVGFVDAGGAVVAVGALAAFSSAMNVVSPDRAELAPAGGGGNAAAGREGDNAGLVLVGAGAAFVWPPLSGTAAPDVEGVAAFWAGRLFGVLAPPP